MMHSASATVRQRTISLSSLHGHRRHQIPSTSRLPHSSPHRSIFSSDTSQRIRHGRALLPFAQGNNGSTPPPSPEDDPQRRELNLLLSLIVQYPAVRGSIAVAVGYFAHVDPWGTFRWDTHDVLIGCSLAILPSLMDIVILLPNWEPERTTRTMKLKMPRDVAEKLQQGGNIKILEPTSSSPAAASENEQETAAAAATANPSSTEALVAAAISLASEGSVTTNTMTIEPDSIATISSDNIINSDGDEPKKQEQQVISDLVDVERKMVVRVDQHPLRDALQSIQMSRVVSNIGRSLSPPSEALLLFLVHVSEEMLYRGVVLVLVVRWCTDNLYYAGVEESIVLPGTGLELAVPQLGAILGGVGLTIGAVGLLVQRELFPLRLLDATKEQLQSFVEDRKKGDTNGSGKEKSAEDAKSLEKKKKVVAGLLERLRSGVVVQQRWIVAVEATVEFLQWSTLSTSFLLTGNILAPIAGSMVNDALYSACQRLKNREIKEAMKERSETVAERAKQTADLLTAVREHRKNRLEPPKGIMAKRGSNAEEEEKKPDEVSSDDDEDSST